MVKVAAAIIREGEKILICKRGEGGNCPFLWEFPGGKLECDETPFEAIVREIKEELCIDIEPIEIFCEYSFSYPDKDIYFYFISAKIVSGEILPTFHKETKWLRPEDLSSLEYCPADIKTVELLKGVSSQ